MKKIEFYESQVRAMDLPVNEEGYVLSPTEDNIKIGGKDLVLPTDELLDKNDWSEVQAYHPLSESILLGLSPVMSAMVTLFKYTYTIKLTTLVSCIVKAASTPEIQAKMKNSKALEVCSLIPFKKATNADKNKALMTALIDGWETADGSKMSSLVKLSMVRDVEHEGTNYLRLATLSFPILEENDPAKLCGVPMTREVRKAYFTMFEHILGEIETVFGSNSKAPYYHSFCQAQAAIVKVYNKYAKLFGLDLLDSSWIKYVDKLHELTQNIGALPNNEGSRLKLNQETKEEPKSREVDKDIPKPKTSFDSNTTKSDESESRTFNRNRDASYYRENDENRRRDDRDYDDRYDDRNSGRQRRDYDDRYDDRRYDDRRYNDNRRDDRNSGRQRSDRDDRYYDRRDDRRGNRYRNDNRRDDRRDRRDDRGGRSMRDYLNNRR